MTAAGGGEVAIATSRCDRRLTRTLRLRRRRSGRAPRRGPGDTPGQQLPQPRGLAARRQVDVRRTDHARRQLVELSAAPARRLAGMPGEQRGDLLLPHRRWPAPATTPSTASACIARTRPMGRSTSTSSIHDGDVFCVPRGYHGPCIAAPGYPMYYLNVLAGPGGARSMAFCDDPTHHWVRDTWADMATDPRCPMTTKDGRTT